MSELRNDQYLQRFWWNCPEEVVDRIDTQVIPAARRTPDSCATDTIMREACNFPWYESASSSGRHQFHCLVGHIVRIARNYVVDRTPSGRPRMLRSERGPHSTFTIQVPRRAAS
jgi:hypothetical protein